MPKINDKYDLILRRMRDPEEKYLQLVPDGVRAIRQKLDVGTIMA
jgi:hypothetical protein